MAILHILLASASLLYPTASYELKANYDASNFFNESSFQFYAGADTFTDGAALYVSKNEAVELGLAKIEDNKVYLGVDTTSTFVYEGVGSDTGRKSVRLEGVETFDNGLVIADFDHLPSGGCGQWPAFWLLHDSGYGEDWYSEIDILEGVSKNTRNELSLHTSTKPCFMQDDGGSGTARANLDCSLSSGGGSCGVNAADGTFGEPFNGGVWAMQFEADGVKSWHFARGNEPSDIGSDSPDPNMWGTPVMNFVPRPCDMAAAFRKMKLIINITFCGRNAGGAAWSGYTNCAAQTQYSTCEEHVANEPGAFADVYFSINSIRVFQHDTAEASSKNKHITATTQTTLTPSYGPPPRSTQTLTGAINDRPYDPAKDTDATWFAQRISVMSGNVPSNHPTQPTEASQTISSRSSVHFRTTIGGLTRYTTTTMTSILDEPQTLPAQTSTSLSTKTSSSIHYMTTIGGIVNYTTAPAQASTSLSTKSSSSIHYMTTIGGIVNYTTAPAQASTSLSIKSSSSIHYMTTIGGIVNYTTVPAHPSSTAGPRVAACRRRRNAHAHEK
ncbi:hypothetical protein BDW02DRAFT_390966 [Decorospora gaudefroyi]|uniref:GH16 domain-containing protein n=1 Tax=Decorospora gaudefroyi TaxID=184978 RepID=A0A6A5KR21_9PLEO|nr:hypothetical protein BDW02DRAFT_390966 [Decorospora gaudefroyi]